LSRGELAAMRRPRGLTHDELALWHHAVRDAAPLHGEPPPPSPPPAPVPPPAPPARSAAPPRPREALPAVPPVPRRLDPAGPVDLDRRSWLRLRRGSYPIDARLDLHGLTQAEAHVRLAAFLAGAQARGNRCVLVITGRGLRRGGTLRENTPRWLETEPNRARVLSFAQARLQHGGEGALYVLLRRRGPGA
jgi:DNA-nicking Smr family endonuclease